VNGDRFTDIYYVDLFNGDLQIFPQASQFLHYMVQSKFYAGQGLDALQMPNQLKQNALFTQYNIFIGLFLSVSLCVCVVGTGTVLWTLVVL